MRMTYDLIIGVAGNLLFFMAGIALRTIIVDFRLRHARQLFRNFNKEKIRVVLSTRPGPNPGSTPRVSLSEIRSYAAFQRTLADLKFRTELCDSEVAIGELRTSNLIVLGGPVANRVSSLIWSAASVGVPYTIDAEKQIVRALPSDFTPEYDKRGKLKLDFGIVVRRRSPLDGENGLVIAAGCHGFGTEACAAMLTQRAQQNALARRTKGQDFAAIIRTELRDNQIISVAIAECVLLPHAEAARH